MEYKIRNETRYWQLPNGALYRKWTEQEMLEIPFGQYIEEKILWIVCKCCGTKIRPHIHMFIRPIDISDCINCKSDVDKKIKHKGWDYIDTKLNAIRYFEKLKDGHWIRDYQIK